MENEFVIEGPHFENDISYRFIQKNEDLQLIEKGVLLKEFRDNINKRDIGLEFKVLSPDNLYEK